MGREDMITGFVWEKPEERRRPLGRPSCKWKDKRIFRK
jgi:hypothetical protein